MSAQRIKKGRVLENGSFKVLVPFLAATVEAAVSSFVFHTIDRLLSLPDTLFRANCSQGYSLPSSLACSLVLGALEMAVAVNTPPQQCLLAAAAAPGAAPVAAMCSCKCVWIRS